MWLHFLSLKQKRRCNFRVHVWSRSPHLFVEKHSDIHKFRRPMNAIRCVAIAVSTHDRLSHKRKWKLTTLIYFYAHIHYSRPSLQFYEHFRYHLQLFKASSVGDFFFQIRNINYDVRIFLWLMVIVDFNRFYYKRFCLNSRRAENENSNSHCTKSKLTRKENDNNRFYQLSRHSAATNILYTSIDTIYGRIVCDDSKWIDHSEEFISS